MTRTVSPSPELVGNLHRLAKWCQAKDSNATIWLHAIEAADALESAQAEIARLTTVSGDMVEEMARAIYQASAFEAERVAGPDCVVSGYDEDDEDAREFARTLAQAAATIAKGRVAELASKDEKHLAALSKGRRKP